MSRKCPSCGKQIYNDTSQLCSHCERLPVVDETESPRLSVSQESRIVEGLSEKLSNDRPFRRGIAWRVFLGLFTVFGIIGTITGWSIWERVRKFEDGANTR